MAEDIMFHPIVAGVYSGGSIIGRAASKTKKEGQGRNENVLPESQYASFTRSDNMSMQKNLRPPTPNAI